MNGALPPGFKLDTPSASAAGAAALPPGFTLDAPRVESIPGARRTWSDVPLEVRENLAPSAQKFYGGLIEAVTSPVQTAKGLADLAAGGMRAGAKAVLPESVFNALDKLDNPETTARISSIANAVGGQYAADYGSIEGVQRKIATDPVAFLADASMLLGGAAAVASRAGAPAGVTGVLRGAETATNPLTPIIAPIKGVTSLAGQAVERGYRMADPRLATYLEAAGGRAPELIEALRSPAAEIIPGSRPLPSQITAPVGAAEFTAFAKSAEKVMPTEVAQRADIQNRARLSAMREVSGAPADVARGRPGALEVAQAERARTSGALYRKAEPEVLPGDEVIESLLDRPSMGEVLRRAQRIAAEKDQTFTVKRPEAPQPTGLVDEAGDPIMSTPEPAQYSVRDLDYIKKGLDDLIKDPQSGLGATERAAIVNTKQEFLKWIDANSDAYKLARDTFAKASGPINQMEVGRYLESRLTQPVSGEATRAGTFASAVREAPATIKKATGETRFSYLSDVLTPKQIDIVENIRKDLAREEKTNVLARKARSSMPNIEKVVTETGDVPRVNWLSRVATIANEVISRFEGKVNRELAMQIATELMDPATTANALEAALRREAAKSAAVARVRRPGEKVVDILSSPALRALPNVMAPQQEEPFAFNAMSRR